ncbi:sigma-70 family RNA polymerase sigma factor [Rhodoglobus sp.]
MSGIVALKLTTSDEQLLAQARTGVQNAFAELWSRHYRSGICVARQYTSIDADDLVSEAFARIYQRVLAGGGPRGAFRPYLYTTIRNLASTWGAASREVQVDEIADYEDPSTIDDPVTLALDRTLTAQAFRGLPERWQSVLWYTEVEGMDPHEVAPILGMSANGVAALSYRAREGLRKARLQAHINDASASGECQWAMSKFGEHARQSLSERDSRRVNSHLESCARCAIVCEEIDEVGSRLALVMIPLLLGGVAGGGFLSAFAQSGAVSLTAAAAPAMPAAVLGGTHFAGVTAGTAASGATVGALPVALAGSLAAAVALTGSLVVMGPRDDAPSIAAPTTQSSDTQGEVSASISPVNDDLGAGRSAPGNLVIPTVPSMEAGTGDSANSTGGLGGVVGGVGNAIGILVDSVVGSISGGAAPEGHTAPGGVVGADIDLNLAGTATPGAHLSLQGAGIVYATTTVSSNGTFVLTVTGVPGGLASLDLVQTVDRNYLAGIVGGGGLLGGILGSLDGLINDLIKPLSLSSGANQGITIHLLN